MNFVCPLTLQKLHLADEFDSRRISSEYHQPVGPVQQPPKRWLVTEDERIAYPLAEDIPVLLGAKAWTRTTDDQVNADIYTGALSDDKLYGPLAAERSLADDPEAERLRRLGHDGGSFLENPTRWVDNSNMIGAEIEALGHVAPIEGRVCLQLGGRGQYACAMAIGGAALAILISPVLDELRYAKAVSALAGVSIEVALGIGEQLPLSDGSIDCAFVPNSLHHMDVGPALGQLQRVCGEDGRFATVDVWRSPLYDIGTKLFGRAVPGADCVPLDRDRLGAPDGSINESYHGALTRYPVAVLQRAGLVPSPEIALRLCDFDKKVARRFRSIERLSSMIVLSN